MRICDTYNIYAKKAGDTGKMIPTEHVQKSMTNLLAGNWLELVLHSFKHRQAPYGVTQESGDIVLLTQNTMAQDAIQANF